MIVAGGGDAKELADVIQAIRDFVGQDLALTIEKGVKIEGMNEGRTVYYQMEFTKDFFLEFEHCPKCPQHLVIDAEIFFNIMKRIGKGSMLEIDTENESFMKLVVDDNDRKITFPVPLVDVEPMSLEVPTVEYDSAITVSRPRIATILGDAELYSDKIMITLGDNGVHFKTRDSRYGEFKAVYYPEDYHVEGPVSSMFSLALLQPVFKARGLPDTCNVEMGNDKPIRVRYEDEGLYNVQFLVAPRIEEEI